MQGAIAGAYGPRGLVFVSRVFWVIEILDYWKGCFILVIINGVREGKGLICSIRIRSLC
jgi:hypothetical protein